MTALAEPDLLTIHETARRLHVHPDTLYRWARDGRFPARYQDWPRPLGVKLWCPFHDLSGICTARPPLQWPNNQGWSNSALQSTVGTPITP